MRLRGWCRPGVLQVTPLEAAALEAAMKLILEALLQKKITPEDVTREVQAMIWKATKAAL